MFSISGALFYLTVRAAIHVDGDLFGILADMKEQLGRVEGKVDGIEKHFDSKMADVAKTQTKQQEEIDNLKEKPWKRWEAIVMAFIGSAVGAVVGYFFKR